MKKSFLALLAICTICFTLAKANDWEVVSEMPVPVSGAVAFTHDSLIYIFGGHNSNDFVTPTFMQVYNPVLNLWRVDTVGTINNSRYGASGGIWQGKAYFFGGYSDSTTTNLDVLRLADNTQLALSNRNDNFNRYFASSEIHDGKIYCFGGYFNPTPTDRRELPYIFIYDLNKHSVETEIKGDYTKDLPSYQMTTRIRNRIYILGGLFNGQLNSISYFNTESKTLHSFSRKMAMARYGGTAHSLGDSAIILIGGWDGRDNVLSEVEIINLKNQGSVINSEILKLNHARAEHVSVKFGDDLYVFGGRNTAIDSDISAVEKFVDFEIITDIADEQRTPYLFKLGDNYPNPFNPSTIINYVLDGGGFISLKVYDITGQLVTTLVEEYKSAGEYRVEFRRSVLASGVYFYTLASGKQSQTKRMLLIR